ncbi:hypothetical protein QBA35_38110 [Streptomyces bottropensis]
MTDAATSRVGSGAVRVAQVLGPYGDAVRGTADGYVCWCPDTA